MGYQDAQSVSECTLFWVTELSQTIFLQDFLSVQIVNKLDSKTGKPEAFPLEGSTEVLRGM